MITGPALIVNADDLGIHPRINGGIFEAFERGILTSATILVTTPFAAETARDVRRRRVPVGLHFSLTLGRALADHSRVSRLIDPEGNLSLSASKLLLLGDRHGRHAEIYEQIELEIEAQFAAADALGLALTHVDSHQHVHMNPHLFKMLESAAERHGVKAIRVTREPWYPFALGSDLVANIARLNPLKLALVRGLGHRVVPRLKAPDYFFGLMYSGQVTSAAMAQFLRSVGRRGGIHELGLHPGYCAPVDEKTYARRGYNAFISAASREAELRMLTDEYTKSMVKTYRIQLMSYRDFAGSGSDVSAPDLAHVTIQ